MTTNVTGSNTTGFDVTHDAISGTKMDTNITTSKPSIARTYHPRLIQLFAQLREECEKQFASQPTLETDEPFCARTIDRFGGCWPDTLPGNTAKIHCPAIPGFNPLEYAYKECNENGTWYAKTSSGHWSNYSLCRGGHQMIEEDRKYIYIFIGGYSLSLVLLIISLAIFFHFKQLRCDRITIHKNLFISYVLTGIAWILYYVLVALDGTVIVNNPLWCRVQHVICQYFLVCNFMWMFCEGLYLNTIMVYAFSSGKTLIICCYIIGWFVPSILTTIYAVLRSKDELASIDCWIDTNALQWIMYGPIVFSIVVNALFLVNIVRLLITKLRQLPEATQTKKATRATLILVPLLGLQYLLIPIKPPAGHPLDEFYHVINGFADGDIWKATRATLILVPLLGLQYLLIPIKPPAGHPLDEFYHVVVALIVSLQGTFVSVMYCFCNGEVIALISRKYTQHRLMRTRSSIKSTSGHAITAYTTIDQVSHHSNLNQAAKDGPQERQLLEMENA